MKKLLLLLLVPFYVNAEECSDYSDKVVSEEKMEINTNVPAHLKGATITVKLANGKESTVPAEKFKVVPRLQQFIVTKSSEQQTRTCKVPAEKEKNRISLLAGHGAQEGLDRTNEPTKTTIESRVGVVGGVQYQRLLTDKLSVGGQIQSNKTGLVNIGWDF